MCVVRDNAVRRKLLQESKLTLEKCVDICRAAEATSAQLKEMAPSQQQQNHASEVDLVTKGDSWKLKARKEKVKVPKNHQLDECKFCGRKHERKRGKCPAYGQTCSSCGKRNHFAVKCESVTGDSKSPNTERSISSLTVMTPAIRPKKKYCQYPQKMLLIPWK